MGCNCTGSVSFDGNVPYFFTEECICIFQSLKKLPDIDDADCNHGYITPDNRVWILNHEGNGWVELKGPKGDTGPKGDKGDKGDIGPKGSDGAVGPKGDKGEPGTAGQKGPKGDTGPKGDKGDKGDKGKDADMNFFNVQQVVHNNKGIGFYYRKSGHSITCEISGISNTDLQNGWHDLANLPESHRPVVALAFPLTISKQNAIQTDRFASITISPNGNVKLRVINFKKGYEYGGNGSWTK